MNQDPESLPPPAAAIDFEEAFAFPFRRERGWSVLVVGGLLLLFSWLVIPLLVALGYAVTLGRAVARGDPELPRFRLGQAADGLRAIEVLFVYSLPFFLLFFLFFIPAALRGDLDEPPEVIAPLLAMGFFGALFALFVYQLLLVVVQPAVFASFIAVGTVGSCFSYQRIKWVIKRWRGSYVGVAAVVFGVGQLVGFGLVLLVVGVAFTSFYHLLLTSHLSGQLARPLLDRARAAGPGSPAPPGAPPASITG